MFVLHARGGLRFHAGQSVDAGERGGGDCQGFCGCGVPVGSELEYVDLGTIAHALVDRRKA